MSCSASLLFGVLALYSRKNWNKIVFADTEALRFGGRARLKPE